MDRTRPAVAGPALCQRPSLRSASSGLGWTRTPIDSLTVQREPAWARRFPGSLLPAREGRWRVRVRTGPGWRKSRPPSLIAGPLDRGRRRALLTGVTGRPAPARPPWPDGSWRHQYEAAPSRRPHSTASWDATPRQRCPAAARRVGAGVPIAARPVDGDDDLDECSSARHRAAHTDEERANGTRRASGSRDHRLSIQSQGAVPRPTGQLHRCHRVARPDLTIPSAALGNRGDGPTPGSRSSVRAVTAP
jgi:hypothetical protein